MRSVPCWIVFQVNWLYCERTEYSKNILSKKKCFVKEVTVKSKMKVKTLGIHQITLESPCTDYDIIGLVTEY